MIRQPFELVAFNLPRPMERGEIEEALGLTFKRGIEATYYAEVGDALVTYTQFNVLTAINWPRDRIIEAIETLGFDASELFEGSGIYQDYPVRIDPGLALGHTIDNDTITLKSYSLLQMLIIAHVISQSVALELYERRLSDYHERSRLLIDAAGSYSIFKRNRLARFAKELALLRHDILIDLHLLDKPNILWDNEEVEMLYNTLAYRLELKDRFDVVTYKLDNIKDDVMMVMDLTNHDHSSFLEWIIIVLIAVEIVMGLIEWFRPGLGH
jgi:uncharacterized Rmd1/YagE family protein